MKIFLDHEFQKQKKNKKGKYKKVVKKKKMMNALIKSKINTMN